MCNHNDIILLENDKQDFNLFMPFAWSKNVFSGLSGLKNAHISVICAILYLKRLNLTLNSRFASPNGAIFA